MDFLHHVFHSLKKEIPDGQICRLSDQPRKRKTVKEDFGLAQNSPQFQTPFLSMHCYIGYVHLDDHDDGSVGFHCLFGSQMG